MRKHYTRPDKGSIYETKQGCQVEVLEYVKYNEIFVKFLDESSAVKKVTKKELVEGSIKNPYHPEVRGVGFFGVGPHKGRESGGVRACKEYVCWANMLTRCYTEAYQVKFPTYKGCTVDKQWHNFQEFAEWCQWQIGFDLEGSVLDKDLLCQGVKIYSPDTCVFLPAKLNSLLVTQDKEGKEVPAGVSYQQRYDRYLVSCAIDGKNKNLGRHKCPEQAFAVYKDFKESLVRSKAEEYKHVVDPRAYHALSNFTIKE